MTTYLRSGMNDAQSEIMIKLHKVATTPLGPHMYDVAWKKTSINV